MDVFKVHERGGVQQGVDRDGRAVAQPLTAKLAWGCENIGNVRHTHPMQPTRQQADSTTDEG
jgi:hypothetical protein